jgi:predicted RNA binding protein YcfA (HicA-like mRNA interferase family)
MSGAEACRILRDHGFAFVRQRGSHVVMQKRLNDSTVTCIVPQHDELRVGTLMSIVRQSRLPRELFEA